MSAKTEAPPKDVDMADAEVSMTNLVCARPAQTPSETFFSDLLFTFFLTPILLS
jgi:hypothetical protein